MCSLNYVCVCVCSVCVWCVCVCVCVNVWVMHRDNKMLSWSCSLLHLELERVKVTYCFSCLLQTLPRAVIQKACSQADMHYISADCSKTANTGVTFRDFIGVFAMLTS